MTAEWIEAIKTVLLPELQGIRESIVRLEAENKVITARLDNLRELMDRRFAEMDKRFEQVDKRFEQVDKRFEQVDKRFEAVERALQELREEVRELRSYVFVSKMSEKPGRPVREGK